VHLCLQIRAFHGAARCGYGQRTHRRPVPIPGEPHPKRGRFPHRYSLFAASPETPRRSSLLPGHGHRANRLAPPAARDARRPMNGIPPPPFSARGGTLSPGGLTTKTLPETTHRVRTAPRRWWRFPPPQRRGAPWSDTPGLPRAEALAVEER